MRRFLTTACLVLAALSASPAYAKFKVVTTFTVIQDIAQNVAGDAATVESITKPGAEIHDYQPTPQDIAKAQSADLVLWNGLNLERWFERFFQNVKNKPAVVVTEGITPMSIHEGPYKDTPNPHAWMSTSNALVYIENIKNALVKYDPKNAAVYTKNAAAYSNKIKQLDKPLRTKLMQVPQNQRFLVSSEGAFSYLAKDYGFKEVYLWPINAEQQGSPQQVRKVIEVVRKNKIPVVFSESTISPKPMKQVAKETGAKYGGVLYVDSLSAKNGPVPTYADLLNTTVSTIVKGFGK
ncbi:ABC transporter substrate-binding protein [Neisseria animaloris]|uniref:metal ABC transporter substrate-binding protein n=1 Tax=Neisseria animaloris TaxID=326522 RepID=UPI000A18B950|nr:metal ABC transporter substrate-binding protein [Neisseria animaloris]OSI07126.1 metal ABC transporter substrate-binding protein [Neisseria animaloris]VEH88007.1 ABC transporter substrate-binding protein [Neisseria animaloris]